jgi:hypothetical protein
LTKQWPPRYVRLLVSRNLLPRSLLTSASAIAEARCEVRFY